MRGSGYSTIQTEVAMSKKVEWKCEYVNMRGKQCNRREGNKTKYLLQSTWHHIRGQRSDQGEKKKMFGEPAFHL